MAISNPVVNSNEVANAFRMPLDNIGIGLQNYTQNALINAEKQAQKQAQLAAQRDRMIANLIPEDSIVTGTAYDDYLRQQDTAEIEALRDSFMKNPNALDMQQQAAVVAQRMQGRRQAAKAAVAGVDQWGTTLGKEYDFVDPSRVTNAGRYALLFDEKGQPRPYTDLNYNYQRILPGDPTTNPEQWAAVTNRAQLRNILGKNLGDAFPTETGMPIPNELDGGKTDLKLTSRGNLEYNQKAQQFITRAEQLAFDVAGANGEIPTVTKSNRRVLAADVYERAQKLPSFSIQTEILRKQRAQSDREFSNLPLEVQRREIGLEVMEDVGPRGGTSVNVDDSREKLRMQQEQQQFSRNMALQENARGWANYNRGVRNDAERRQRQKDNQDSGYNNAVDLLASGLGANGKIDPTAAKRLTAQTIKIGPKTFVNAIDITGTFGLEHKDPNTRQPVNLYFIKDDPTYGDALIEQGLVPEIVTDVNGNTVKTGKMVPQLDQRRIYSSTFPNSNTPGFIKDNPWKRLDAYRPKSRFGKDDTYGAYGDQSPYQEEDQQ